MEDRFHNIIEASPDAIVIVDEKGKIYLVNDRANKLFHCDETFVGSNIEKFILNESLPILKENFSKFLMDKTPRKFEVIACGCDSKQVAVEMNLSHVDSVIGNFTLITIRDLTERRLAENRFKDMLEAVPDGIVIIDEQGKITLINEQTTKIFGYEKNELLNEPVEILIPEPYRVRHPQHRNSFFSSPRTRPMGQGMDLYGLRKNGEIFPVEISLSPLKTKDGLIALATVRDITDRKRIEKMKSEFISTVSHELRTPLTAILGSIEIIYSKSLNSADHAYLKLLEIAKQNCVRLNNLINDILDIDKLESNNFGLNLGYIRINELIEEAVLENESYADKFNVNLVIEKPLPIQSIYADRSRIIQVMANLISNAVKYSPPDAQVVVAAKTTDDKVIVSITDKGSGVPKEFYDRIFTKFAQADSSSTRSHSGTGLGLHISKNIIEKHGGMIYFESVQQKGTTFYFELPLAKKSKKIKSTEDTII